jgi:1-acyl-sn-glycerol-3-phosphate acyltransferase
MRALRWTPVGEVPEHSAIVVGGPHTSNWDWVATLLMMWGNGAEFRVLVKQELFKGPVGSILRATGGIPLDRRNPGGIVRRLVEEARREDERFLLVLAAEGTRGKAEYWKSGFYRIAQQSGLPIAMGFVDGRTRTVGFGPTIRPTGDVRADMDLVRAFYADKYGFRPENRTEPRLREELPGARGAEPRATDPESPDAG